MKNLLIVSLLFLFACTSSSYNPYTTSNYGTEAAPDVYAVKQKDTLFSIAWRFGLDIAEIQRKNGIDDPNKIFVGQKLRFNTMAKTTTPEYIPEVTQPISDWVWPMRGKVVRNFHRGRIGANGIRIAGHPNQTVNAADGGVVAYQGNGLNGYGNVIIIKHKNGVLSAYGFLSKTYVKEGQTIKKRQKIGTVGYAANRKLMLHFEVRKKGKPINPKHYIGNAYRF